MRLKATAATVKNGITDYTRDIAAMGVRDKVIFAASGSFSLSLWSGALYVGFNYSTLHFLITLTIVGIIEVFLWPFMTPLRRRERVTNGAEE